VNTRAAGRYLAYTVNTELYVTARPLVVALIAGGCTGRSAPAATGSAGAEARPVPVQVAAAQREDLPVWIEGLGTVAAFQQVTVRPQVDGRLDKVLFTEGQAVKAGDVLAQIDPRPFLVQLHTAEGALARDRAQRDSFKRTYDRDRSLKEQQLIAQATVDNDAGQLGQAEGAMKIDEAAIESARLNLDYATVRSPLAGTTGVRQVDAGNIVHQTDPNGLVVITAIDPAAVFLTVPQDRLPQIASALARGDVPTEVYGRDGAQLLGKGKLAVLDNQVNQTTATLRLKALVDNPQRALWPNAFVKARVLVEMRKGALVIPGVAVQQGPQGAYVYVVGADGTAAMKPVVVAFTTGEKAVIERGLDGGEQVVIEGANQLRPGGKAIVQQPQQQQPRGSAAGPTAANTPAPQ
jgi:multidrug efflux system membrane fusion protein